MKKFNKFLDTASLWKIFLLSCLFFTPFCAIAAWYIIERSINSNTVNIVNLALFSITIGILYSLFVTHTFSQSRKSQKFWDFAKVVEESINRADTLVQLHIVRIDKLKRLKEMAMGGSAHFYEVQRLETIMETKIKYIK